MGRARIRPPPFTPRRSVVVLAVLAVGFTCLYWRRLVLFGQLPVDGNLLRLFHPSWLIGKELLADGRVLWDPFRNLGQPFLADPQNQALYPFRLLSLVTNYPAYHRMFVIFHSFLAATGAFLLAQRWHRNRPAALLAALLTGFGGFLMMRATLAPHLASLAWVPLILLALVSGRPIVLGVSLTLQWMAGFPPFTILTLVCAGVMILTASSVKSSVIVLGKGAMIALGLAAVQFLPFIEMLRESDRPIFLSSTEALEYSLAPAALMRRLFLPSFIPGFDTSSAASDPAMTAFYIGLIPFGLAVMGIARGHRRERIVGVAAATALVLSLGSHLGFYRFIPFITVFRYPGNWLLMAWVFMALAAAAGAARIRNIKVVYGLMALAAMDLLLFAWPIRTTWTKPAFVTDAPRAPLSALADVHNNERIFHRSSIVDTVHSWTIREGEDWLTIKGALVPSSAAGQGLREAVSMGVLASRRHNRFISRLNAEPASSRLFDVAGIRWIVDVRPGTRNSVPERSEFVVDRNSDPYPRAFFENGEPVLVLNDQPGRIDLEAAGPGLLVISESYNAGWMATVNAQKHSVEAYEDAFLSLRLGPGFQRVRLRYLPWSFLAGLFISITTALVLFALTGKRAVIKKGFPSRVFPDRRKI